MNILKSSARTPILRFKGTQSSPKNPHMWPQWWMYQTPCRTTWARWVWDEGVPASSEVRPPTSASLLSKSRKWAATVCPKAVEICWPHEFLNFSSAWGSSKDVTFFTHLRCSARAQPRGRAWAGGPHPSRIINTGTAQASCSLSLAPTSPNLNADPSSLLFPTRVLLSRMDTPESRIQSWNGFSAHVQSWSSGLSLNQGSRNKRGFQVL